MGWVIPAITAVGSIANAMGSRKQTQSQNAYYQHASQLNSARATMGGMQQYNPGLFGAMQGGNMPQQPGYAQNMWNMANNPGYIDPQLMNAPLQMSQRRMTNDFVEAQGRLGRSSMRGGLSSGYGLANLAARTQRDVQTQQQYALWRENQRRQDLGFITNQYNQLMQTTMGGQQAQAAPYMQMQAPQSGWTSLGNAASSGLAAYGGMGGGGNPNALASQGVYQWGNRGPSQWPSGQDNMLPGGNV